MGESWSKATVLENMIKNFKKGFDGTWQDKDDAQPALHSLPGWMACDGSRLASRKHYELN